MRKNYICFILVLCLCLQPITASAYASAISENENTLVLSLVCDTPDVDLSGIIIDVYSAVLSFSNIEAGYYEYNENFSFSVVTDGKGKAIIKAPSEAFSISVRLDSLPQHHGIDEHTRFFLKNTSSYSLNLYEITSVTVKYENDEVIPVLSNKDSNRVFASTSVEINPEPSSIQSYELDKQKKCILHTDNVVVSVYDQEYIFEHDSTFSYANNVDLYGYLFGKNLISEEEYINALCECVINGQAKEANNEAYVDNDDMMEIYWIITDYYERQDRHIINNNKLLIALSMLDEFTPITESTYESSSNGHFRVYYDDAEILPEVAEAVADEFQSVDTLFCTNWGFRRPIYDTSTPYYKVYIMSDIPADGVTKRNGANGSYIQIRSAVANNVCYGDVTEEYPDTSKGVIAHEYMHAIMFMYGIQYDTSQRQWMHESFASWAGIAYEPDYAARCSNNVRNFLHSNSRPLDYFTTSGIYQGRHYGSCVFPLFIQQKIGGYGAIKRILLKYSLSENPFDAIDSGLSAFGYDLASAYAGCASYNGAADYFYSGIPSSGYNAWGSGFLENCVTSVVPRTIDRLSCYYHKKTASENTISTLTITVDFSNISNGAIPMLKTIRETDDGDKFITTQVVSSNRCTIIQYNFGYFIAKSITIIPMNASNTGTVAYIKTVSQE